MKYLLILLILCSCASNKANRKLKRANRLIAQAEQLGAKVTADTIFKTIPVFIESVKYDSIFTSRVGDTVYLEKDRLKIKYIKLPGDSVFISGNCDADTVKITVPMTVNKKIKTGLGVLTAIQWSILALLIGAVLARIFWK